MVADPYDANGRHLLSGLDRMLSQDDDEIAGLDGLVQVGGPNCGFQTVLPWHQLLSRSKNLDKRVDLRSIQQNLIILRIHHLQVARNRINQP